MPRSFLDLFLSSCLLSVAGVAGSSQRPPTVDPKDR